MKFSEFLKYKIAFDSHSLRGVWVEIEEVAKEYEITVVTPFGECGLKLQMNFIRNTRKIVTPFGECGLKSTLTMPISWWRL